MRSWGAWIRRADVVCAGGALALFMWLARYAEQPRSAWEGVLLGDVGRMESDVFETVMVAFSFFGTGIGLLLLLSAVSLVLVRRDRRGDAAFLSAALLLAQVLDRFAKSAVGSPRPPHHDPELVHAVGDFRQAVLVVVAAAFLTACLTPWRRHALLLAAIFAGAFLVFEVVTPAVIAPDNHSYPSGHATSSMAFAAGVVTVAWRSQWRWAIMGAAVLFVLGVGLSRTTFGVHYPSDVMGGWLLGGLSVLALRVGVACGELSWVGCCTRTRGRKQGA